MLLVQPLAAAEIAFRDLGELTIEELAALPITSVARRETRLDRSPASIFVITAEDIRRSGATTIPEILRLAPNLQVARINSVDYAITSRGFNNAVGNKLLVLIDGRTVYTPTFSGVFWEMQDTMIADIERIEVVSGPGGALWGANAVNGVINVITRPAGATQGTLATGDAGTDERGAAVRHGGTAGDAGAYRLYARTREWDGNDVVGGGSALDQWRRHQAGFRIDWGAERDTITVQGDAYTGSSERRGEVPARNIRGYNLLGRWTRLLDDGGDVSVQAYLDHMDRDEALTFQPDIDTFDIEFEHTIPLDAHRFLWGGGYRHARDTVVPGTRVRFIPASASMDWYNLFAQSELQLTPRVAATLGLKVESNPFTGSEYLPGVRVAWQRAPNAMLWGSASRTVRSPARFDRHAFIPGEPPFLAIGGPTFMSEVADVFELGYRAQPSPVFSYSVTAFRYDWDHLRSGSPPPPPLTIENHVEGTSSGVEGWAHWQVSPRWRVSGGGMWLRKSLRLRPGVPEDTAGPDSSALHNDPDYQLLLHSRTNLGNGVELDLILRRVAKLTIQPVPAYTEFDLRLGWVVTPDVSVALVGRNLLNSAHSEFVFLGAQSEFERSALLRVEWRF